MLKRNDMLAIEFDLRNVSTKKYRETRLVFRVKGIIFIKKHILPLL